MFFRPLFFALRRLYPLHMGATLSLLFEEEVVRRQQLHICLAGRVIAFLIKCLQWTIYQGLENQVDRFHSLLNKPTRFTNNSIHQSYFRSTGLLLKFHGFPIPFDLLRDFGCFSVQIHFGRQEHPQISRCDKVKPDFDRERNHMAFIIDLPENRIVDFKDLTKDKDVSVNGHATSSDQKEALRIFDLGRTRITSTAQHS